MHWRQSIGVLIGLINSHNPAPAPYLTYLPITFSPSCRCDATQNGGGSTLTVRTELQNKRGVETFWHFQKVELFKHQDVFAAF